MHQPLFHLFIMYFYGMRIRMPMTIWRERFTALADRLPACVRGQRITAGDLVRLRSGGIAMTAIWAGRVAFAPGRWVCAQWFDANGELKQEFFPQCALRRTARQDAT
ncbi:YodC family protein [Burkholderia singularis]|nr:YodC family protein [Burkholderia singularis]